MTLTAALWASSTALTGKAALAFWTAAFLFLTCDQRKLTLLWQVLLTLGALTCSAFASSQASSGPIQWMWWASTAAACVSGVARIRAWAQTNPRQAFDESSQVDRAVENAKSSVRHAARKHRTQNVLASPVEWIELAGWLMAALAISLSVYATIASGKTAAWLCTLHALAACILWGVGIFCAIELTFGSAPASLAAVSWSAVAWIAIVCWIAESCVSGAIILSPIDDTVDLRPIAMARLFAVSVLLMDFVVWMIPHRAANFKRTGKATAWVSLTLAAWVGAISLAVLCALPSNWPWNDI